MSEIELNSESVPIDELTLSGDFTIQGLVTFAEGEVISNEDGLVASSFQGINFFGELVRLHSSFNTPRSRRDVVVANTVADSGVWIHYAVVRETGITSIYCQVIDNSTGGFGYIAADNIQF